MNLGLLTRLLLIRVARSIIARLIIAKTNDFLLRLTSRLIPRLILILVLL